MTKVGIMKIGFVEQETIDDEWMEQEAQQEESGAGDWEDAHWFESVDQEDATLEESLDEDETGLSYTATLDFTVRTGADMALARKYARRPLVIKAVAVDGRGYTIGTKQYPVRMATQNRYAGRNTREVRISVTYQSVAGVMN